MILMNLFWDGEFIHCLLILITLRIQVHIADGIQFVRENASSGTAQIHSKSNDPSYTDSPSNESSTASPSHAEGVEATKVDIVIVDVDSSDSR